jgi:hypothetical protein
MTNIRACLFLSSVLVAALAIQFAYAPNAKSAPADSGEKKKEDKPAKKGRGKFTISKETTYVTEPLDKDGYIDYARALNQRLRQGVTPENNANVLLWKAIGPKAEHRTISAEFFQELGMQAPPEKGKYFIDDFKFMREHLKIDPLDDEGNKVYDEFERARERPWTSKEYPKVVSWLEKNDKALTLVVEASKRTQFYSPLIPTRKDNRSSGLIGTLLGPGLSKNREMAGALGTRAMLRLGEAKYDDAWQDLLACHRLGRLVGRGPFLIDSLVGIAIEGVARRGEIAFLDSAKVNAKKLQDCLRDLQTLPAFTEIADKADLGERLFFLDMLMTIDRDRSQFLKGFSLSLEIGGGFWPGLEHLPWPSSEEAREKLLKLLSEVMKEDIDWDPALQAANAWCDRLAAFTRGKDRITREKQWEQIESEVKKLRKKVESGGAAETFHNAKDKASAAGMVVVDLEISLGSPIPVHKIQNAADRIKQELDNVQIAFALTWYERDHGAYPKTLDALAPKYLKQVPQDIFSGKPLIYRPSEKGFVLYSVGYNGKDDGGHDREDDPPGDDLVIRIPLPQLPPK